MCKDSETNWRWGSFKNSLEALPWPEKKSLHRQWRQSSEEAPVASNEQVVLVPSSDVRSP